MQGPGLPSPGQPSVIRPLIAFLRWCRNIHLLPISYAFLPRLRGRLTLRRLTLRRKPWAYSEEALHLLYRYSCQHSHFRYLQRTSQCAFSGLRNALLPCKHACIRSFGDWLKPRYIFRRMTRSVSYYAFFKGWLLLSQPPDCFDLPTSFPTEPIFGTLADGLGCCPLDTGR